MLDSELAAVYGSGSLLCFTIAFCLELDIFFLLLPLFGNDLSR